MAHRDTTHGHGPPMLYALAAAAIGIGTASYELDAVTMLVVVALVVSCIALFAPRLPSLRAIGEGTVVDVLSVAIVATLGFGLLNPPLRLPAYQFAMIGLVIAAVWVLRYAGERRRPAFVAVVLVHFGLIAWALAAQPPPLIDVIQFQQEGSAALVQGVNPYGLRFENIYPRDTPFYSPEVIDGDRVKFGFPYPPVSLVLALPGHVLTGDYRYGAAAAVSAAALLIGFVHRGRLATGAALLMLLVPATWTVLFNGWSESFSVLALAATVFVAARAPLVTPFALGVLMSSKQYLIPLWLAGVVTLESIRHRVGAARLALIPLVVAALSIVPFLLWDSGSFLYSTVTFHNLQPFREDGMSLTALAARAGLGQAPAWLGFLAAGAALLLVVLRAPRTVAGFSAGSAIVLLAFFLFGKQAAVNYYYLALAALLAAAAVYAAGDGRPGDIEAS